MDVWEPSDQRRVERQIREMSRVISAQADVIAAQVTVIDGLLERRHRERRLEGSGMGSVPGLDRRKGERRER